MNVSGLSSLSGLSRFVSTAAPDNAVPGADDSGNAGDGSTTTQISQQGQFLSQLQSLGQTNPTEAKQILTEMSTQLSQRAEQLSGDQAQALVSMAAKLQTAAIAGDLTVLTARGSEQEGQGARGDHRQGGGAKPSSRGASAYTHRARASDMSLMDMLSADAAGDSLGPSGRAGINTSA